MNIKKSNYNYALSPIQFIPLIAIGLFEWEAFKPERKKEN